MSISRRRFLVTTSAGLAASAWPFGAFGQQAPTPPAAPQAPTPPLVPTFTPLRNNVGFFTGQGGTIGWLVARDGVAVVDAQMGKAAEACLAGIKERAGDRPIDVLFNTHHHYDHTDGNSVFRPATKRIVAHANVPELQKKSARPGTEAMQVYADAVFGKAWGEELGKERVTAVHYGPAHTAGDAIITFERANVVHVGDLVFNRRMPVTDRPGGCQIAGWIPVLEQIVKAHRADTIYIFGHAKQGLPVTGSKADLLLQRDFLSALLDYVRTQSKAGKSKDEIVKASPEFKAFPEHGPVSERVLTAAYEEVVG